MSLVNNQPSLEIASVFEYVPNAGFIGSDTFTYEVYDSANPVHKSALATVAITVGDSPEDSDDDGLGDAREAKVGNDP